MDGILGQIGAPTTPVHHLAQVLLNQVGMECSGGLYGYVPPRIGVKMQV